MADQNLKIQLTAIDKTRQAFASVAGGLRRVGGSIANVRVALTGLAAAAGLREFATQIDDLAKASSRLGLTVNQIQSLQFAASQTGASSEELEKGLTRFSRAISEASTGIGTGLRAFEALGITLTDQAGNLRPTNELLNEVSDALTQIESPADRVRIAFDLFGRSGVNLVNTLQAGSGELNKLRDEFNAVTIELTGDQAAAVEKANDQFDKLGRTFQSIGQFITATVLPPLADLATFLTVQITKGFANAIKGARDFINFFVDAYNQLGETIDALPRLEEVTFGKELEMNLRRIAGNFMIVNGEVREFGNNKKEIDGVNESINNTALGFERVGNLSRPVFEQFPNFIRDIKHLKVEFKETGDEVVTLQDKMMDAADRGVSSLEDSLAGILTKTSSVKDAFRSMAQSILADLTRIAIQQSVTDPLRAAFGLTGKAIGGSVQRGQPYMVGERGPEMFVPNQSGSIIPNGQTGGGSVTISQTVNLSTGVAQTVRTEVMNMLPQIQQAAVSGVIDAKRRGGSFGSVFGA